MTIWYIRNACWIPMATNTLSEYVKLYVFPLQQWLYEQASLSRCTYTARPVFSKATRPALGPIQDPLQWVQGSLFPGVKWQEGEADYWPSYTVRVNIPTYVLITCSGTTLPVPLQSTEIHYSPEAHHSPWSTAEVKSHRNYTPLQSYASTHSNFTFTFLSHICRTRVILQ